MTSLQYLWLQESEYIKSKKNPNPRTANSQQLTQCPITARLRGSHRLSARRAQRTKSSRSEGPKAGPKVRQLEVGARLYKYKWYACGVMIRYDQACNLCNLIQESEWWWRQCCIPFSAQGYTASYEKIKIMTIAMMRTRKNMMVLCKDFFSSSAQKNVADNDVSLKILNIRNKEET